ncbi:MAG: hypothetical protein SFX73_40230 [Kofleriaceae bacterium]|nr:hypothetical protein [Kofleriaceae bacterium]
MRGFSFASVVLSYFLVGGGMFVGLLAAGLIKVESEMVVYALMAAGAAVGGFVAARASLGSTILEAAIGAVAVVATVVGLAAGTEVGKLLWHVAPDATMKFVGTIGVAATGGAIAGAFVSEKLLGEPSASSLPWLLYAALATFGACVLATVFASVLATSAKNEADVESLAAGLIAGMGIGALLAGLASGASARARPLLTCLLGGGLGTAGFVYLIKVLAGGGAKTSDGDATTAIAVFGVLGAVVTLIGTLIGWFTVGKRNAQA